MCNVYAILGIKYDFIQYTDDGCLTQFECFNRTVDFVTVILSFYTVLCKQCNSEL